MSVVKIMNLSSGGILFFGESTSVLELNLKYDLKWDTTEVIGRMNGVKNYSNTTKTRAFKIIGFPKDCKYSAPESRIAVPRDITTMKAAFDIISSKINPNRYVGKNGTNFYNTGAGSIDRFFYPSYQEEGLFLSNPLFREQKTQFMQSAPLFFLEFKNENLKIRTYCIIRSFNFNSAGKDVDNKKQPEKFELSFEIEELSSDITQISSMVYIKSRT